MRSLDFYHTRQPHIKDNVTITKSFGDTRTVQDTLRRFVVSRCLAVLYTIRWLWPADFGSILHCRSRACRRTEVLREGSDIGMAVSTFRITTMPCPSRRRQCFRLRPAGEARVSPLLDSAVCAQSQEQFKHVTTVYHSRCCAGGCWYFHCRVQYSTRPRMPHTYTAHLAQSDCTVRERD